MNRFCPISGTHARQIRLLLMAILTLSSSEATPQATTNEPQTLTVPTSQLGPQVAPSESDFKVLGRDQSAGN